MALYWVCFWLVIGGFAIYAVGGVISLGALIQVGSYLVISGVVLIVVFGGRAVFRERKTRQSQPQPITTQRSRLQDLPPLIKCAHCGSENSRTDNECRTCKRSLDETKRDYMQGSYLDR
jgi:hypothetical protein